MSENRVFGRSGQFLDIFSTFSDILSAFQISGLSNDLPVTTVTKLTSPKPLHVHEGHMFSSNRWHVLRTCRTFAPWIHFSGPQKGPAERGHVKKRQKSSKSVKNIFDTFRHFSRRAKNVKKSFIFCGPKMMAKSLRKGHVGPLFTSFPKSRGTQTFTWGPQNVDCGLGGRKLMFEKCMCFFCLLILSV